MSFASVYNPRKPLISNHIPKCAGTSFLAMLKHWFGARLFTHYPNESLGKAPVKHDLSEIAGPVCVHGHFNYERGNGIEDYYPDASQRIAIVRDPFDLHLSNYFYGKKLIKNERLWRNGRETCRANFPSSLNSYLENSRKSFIPKFFPSTLTSRNCADYFSEDYLYVGIFEDLDTSCKSLARLLGFSYHRLPHDNPAERDEEVPDQLLERFKEDNPLAYAIYDYAKSTYKRM